VAGELTSLVVRFLDALDRGDADVATGLISADAQGIDEVSRRWIRGQDELKAFAGRLLGMGLDLRSEIRDAHEATWGDTGIVTFWLEQDATVDGAREHVSAPTTYVFRREDGEWRLVLGHSIPLPPG
jgi:ketosteroid isomerase-like protein